MFITPIKVSEYLLAYSLSGVAKAFVIFFISSIAINAFFHYDIFSLGMIPLTVYIINLIFFSFSLGIVILGLIFRLGTRIQAFAWGLLPVFQPLSAALYPISVLPVPLQIMSYLLPPSFIFESARYTLKSGGVQWGNVEIAFIENIIYFILAIFFFNYMFKKSKETGQFARNEGS